MRGHLKLAVIVLAPLCAVAILYLDRPLLEFLREDARGTPPDILATWIANSVLPIGALAIFVFAVQKFWSNPIPLGLTYFALAGSAAFSALILNKIALKPLFGRASTWVYLRGGTRGFDLFNGGLDTTGGAAASFPSTHVAITAAFFTVIWAYSPRSRLSSAAAVILVAIMNVLSGWHFLSDVLAGLLVGIIVARALLVWHLRNASTVPAP